MADAASIVTAISAGVAAAATVAYAAITWRQWRVLQQQIDQTREQLNLMRRSIELERRAWVTATTTVGKVRSTGTWLLRFSLENAGNGPSFELRLRASTTVAAAAEIPKATAFPGTEVPLPQLLLHAKQSRPIEREVGAPAPDAIRVGADQNKSIYVRVELTYRDQFDLRRQWSCTYRHEPTINALVAVSEDAD